MADQNQIYLHEKKLHFSYSNRESITEDRVEQEMGGTQNKILLVTITKVKLPVTADVLYSVFFTYGEV